MRLSNLIRGKNGIKDVATATLATVATVATLDFKNTGTVAKVATVAVANSEKRKTASLKEPDPGDMAVFWCWLLHFTDRDPLTVTFSPAVSHAEALEQYPDAVAAEPVSDHSAADGQPVPLDQADEATIRAWLASVGEDDQTTITEVLEGCRRDAEARRYFIRRAKEAPQPDPTPDDRVGCWQCARLHGERCTAGRVVFLDIPQRCAAYAPTPGALSDQPKRKE
jgi:hypothetical protein